MRVQVKAASGYAMYSIEKPRRVLRLGEGRIFGLQVEIIENITYMTADFAGIKYGMTREKCLEHLKLGLLRVAGSGEAEEKQSSPTFSEFMKDLLEVL